MYDLCIDEGANRDVVDRDQKTELLEEEGRLKKDPKDSADEMFMSDPEQFTQPVESSIQVTDASTPIVVEFKASGELWLDNDKEESSLSSSYSSSSSISSCLFSALSSPCLPTTLSAETPKPPNSSLSASASLTSVQDLELGGASSSSASLHALPFSVMGFSSPSLIRVSPFVSGQHPSPSSPGPSSKKDRVWKMEENAKKYLPESENDYAGKLLEGIFHDWFAIKLVRKKETTQV